MIRYRVCGSFFPYICNIETNINLCANMNAKEKAIIEAIIDKDDKKRHDKALTLLLWGEKKGTVREENSYVKCLNDLVRKKCGGVCFNDAYSVFASEFWMHLDEIDPQRLREIKDLQAWLNEVAKNFIESIRKQIEEFKLGDTPINEGVLTGDDTYNGGGETDELQGDSENDREEKAEEEENEGNESSKQCSKEESGEWMPFDETEQDELERVDFARWRFRHYLDQMTNVIYKDLLEAVYIEGIERETIAEEYGWTIAVCNLTLDHARNALITVALDDIQRCEPDLFTQYECHDDMDDETANLLHEFFIGKYDVKHLALLHHKTVYDMKKTLSVAYKKLLRIHKKETELKETSWHKQEKTQKRMERLWKLYKGIVKKEYPRTYWLLLKYFNEFNGDFSAMTEWALNNNRSIAELNKQLETSYDVLNAIDKERYRIKKQKEYEHNKKECND